jgi:hypothetical protein
MYFRYSFILYFQDLDLSWNTNKLENRTRGPDFTLCFEETVLAWVPTAFLILSLPYDFYSVLEKPVKLADSNIGRRRKIWSPLFAFKSLLSACLITIQFSLGVYHYTLREKKDRLFDIEVYTPLIRVITFVTSHTAYLFNLCQHAPR